MYEWQFGLVFKDLAELGRGIWVTFKLTSCSIAIGVALGIVVALCRLSKNAIVNVLITVYMEIFRCTPLLVLIVWAFYSLPMLLHAQLSGFVSGVIVLSLYAGMVYGETIRSGIQAIPSEEVDAARALGLSHPQILRYVVLPQALRLMIPPFISWSVSIFKESSLISTVGVPDLMYQARMTAVKTYRPLEALTLAAIFYFVIAYPLTVAANILEKKWRSKVSREAGI